MHTLNCVKCAGVIIKVNNVPYSFDIHEYKSMIRQLRNAYRGGGGGRGCITEQSNVKKRYVGGGGFGQKSSKMALRNC